MGSIKKKDENETGKKKKGITMEVGKEMIEKLKWGIQESRIAKLYSINHLHNTEEEDIIGLDAAKGVRRISKQQPRVLEDAEKLLLVWINEKQVILWLRM